MAGLLGSRRVGAVRRLDELDKLLLNATREHVQGVVVLRGLTQLLDQVIISPKGLQGRREPFELGVALGVGNVLQATGQLDEKRPALLDSFGVDGLGAILLRLAVVLDFGPFAQQSGVIELICRAAVVAGLHGGSSAIIGALGGEAVHAVGRGGFRPEIAVQGRTGGVLATAKRADASHDQNLGWGMVVRPGT